MSCSGAVLVIDDDLELCSLIQGFLSEEGFEAECAHSGRDGVERVRRRQFDLVLLDVMLPDTSGFRILQRLRAESRTPVIMLTARGDTRDRVLGLDMGADDYLPKPFDPPELAARIRAVLRRVHAPVITGSLSIGDLEIEFVSRAARLEGKPVDLTTVEFELLAALMRAAGTALSRDRLSRDVLGRDYSPFDRSIDTHIYNLRRKLGEVAGGSERIKSIRGEGYVFLPVGRAGNRH